MFNITDVIDVPVFIANVEDEERTTKIAAHRLRRDAETTSTTADGTTTRRDKQKESGGESIYVNIMYFRVILSYSVTFATVKLLMP